jgi:hemoglobin-like flavoprotein
LTKILTLLVKSLDNLEPIIKPVQDLAKRHSNYGVDKKEHYDAVGSALIYALKTSSGESWSEELQNAWVNTYTTVSKVMMDAQEIKY